MIRFAACLYSAAELGWFSVYVNMMGAKLIALADPVRQRPVDAPAWDNWFWIGIEIDPAKAPTFINRLPRSVKVSCNHETQMPNELLTD